MNCDVMLLVIGFNWIGTEQYLIDNRENAGVSLWHL